MTVTPTRQLSLFGAAPTATPPPPARRNLVIEAGAGTGKTTAIVAEVLKIMLGGGDVSPERIVLMTFTEKAAGEIADRIRIAITELAARFERGDERLVWPIDSPRPLVEVPRAELDSWRRACERQLARIDSLRSQTIHSFCQTLLRQFPIEAGLDPQFKIVEGFERSLLYGQLYDSWIDAETRHEPDPAAVAEWEFLLAHFGYLFQIRDAIFSLLERRDLLTGEDGDCGYLAEIEPDLLDAVATIRFSDTREIADAGSQRLFAYLRRNNAPDGQSIDQWIDYLAPITTAIRDVDLPRKKAHEEVKEALRILRSGDKGHSIYDRLVSHRAAMALQSLTRRFIAHLDREKRKLGLVDFDDLLLRTVALLDNDAVLERVRTQFDFLFVDEFQDTDRTQARIIDKLARDAGGAHVAGKTVLVGDPKQSIYGFRRADPETYHQMTRELVDGGAEHRVIADQYRSDPPLVDAINALFGVVFPPVALHDPNVFRPSYHQLRAGKTKVLRELDARVTFLRADGEGGFAQAEAIAEWIARHRDGGPDDLKRFALLFRRLTILDDYLDTLDRYGIDYVLPPTRLFLDRRAPVDLLAVLRSIAWPFDRGAEISAARTPYFALTDEEIARGLLLDDEPTWRELRASLARYRECAAQLTVAQLIDLVIATSGIEAVYDASADGVRSKRHLEHLRAIAFEYDRKIGGSVRQFVDEISRRRGDPDEMEPSLIDESRNAVRILSVHAAKGLEFETVILPDLDFRSNSDGIQLFTVSEPPSLVMSNRAETLSGFTRHADGEPLRKIATRREEAETRRLFYVAVTRAMTDVVFVINPEEVRNSGFYKCMLEAFGLNKEQLGTLWPAMPERRVAQVPLGESIVPVAFEVTSPRNVTARRRRRLTDGALESELFASPIVPPSITTPDEASRMEPGDVTRERARAAQRAPGILLHRVLERWDGASPLDALLTRLAAEAGLDEEAVTRVRARLATIAQSAAFARIAAAETVGRELPLRYLDANGELVERRIDRLIRENGMEVVVDYKSGRPNPLRLEKDREQVLAYCNAVAAITGRPCRGVLWYIDLDGDELLEVS